MSSPGISEEDRERIEQFLEKPAYERDPEQLMPDGEGESESEESDGDDA